MNRMMRDAQKHNSHLKQLQDQRSSPPQFLREPRREDPYLRRVRERRKHERDPSAHYLRRRRQDRDGKQRKRRSSWRGREVEDENDRYRYERERYSDDGSSSSSRSSSSGSSEKSYSSDFSYEYDCSGITRVQRELWLKELFKWLYSRKLKRYTDLKKREKLEKEGRSLKRSRSQSPRDYSNTEEAYGNEDRENTPPRSEKEVDQSFQRMHSTRTHSFSRCSRYRDPLALELEKLRREKEKKVHYLQERTRRTRHTDDSDADEDFDPRKYVVDVHESRRHPDARVRDEENGQSRGAGAVARLTNLPTQPSFRSMGEKERNANRYYDGDLEDYNDRSLSSSLRSDRREAPPAYEEHNSYQKEKRDLFHSSGAGRFSSISSSYASPADPLLQRHEPNQYADPMSSSSPRRSILKDGRGAAGVGSSFSETPRGGGVSITGERRSALTPFSTSTGAGLVVPSLRLNDSSDESPRHYDSRQSPSRYTPSSSSGAEMRRAPTFSRTAPPARGSPLSRLAELEDDEDER